MKVFKKMKVLGVLTLVIVLLMTFRSAWADHGGMDPFLDQTAAVFKQMLNIIKNEYIEERDLNDCLDKILKGGLGLCLDTHSRYVDKKRMADLFSEGNYWGIGIAVFKKDQRVFIASVFENSPAEKAGLKINDLVLEIDGISTKDITLDDLVDLISNPDKKIVQLKIDRKGRMLEFVLTKERIIYDVLKYRMMGKFGYIKISEFSGNLMSIFKIKMALEEVVSQKKAEAVIIDLRDNPGGSLFSVLKITDYFTQKDDKILMIKNRFRENSYKSKETGPYFGIKLAVLVNENSASASEIFAGALQDLEYATIIGTKTRGKGSVQNIFALMNGSAFILTTDEYFVGPNEKKVNKIGLTPDIEVKMTEADFEAEQDPQLEKAVEFLKNSLEN